MTSYRADQVGEQVREEIMSIIRRDLKDPRIGFVSITAVRMSPDLKLATIYVMPLGRRDTDIVIAALERNKKYLRGEVARRVNLKFAPDIRFRVDDRFDEAERIEKLLRTPAVQRDLASDSDEN